MFFFHYSDLNLLLKMSVSKNITATINIYLVRLYTSLSLPSGVLEVCVSPGSFQSTALLEARSRTS